MTLDELRALARRLSAELDAYQPPTPPTPPPAPSLPGQQTPRHPRIRQFDTATAIRVRPTDGPLQTVVARNPTAKFFLLDPGDYQVDDLRGTRDLYILGREGAGSTRLLGTGYCIRAKDPGADNVTVGGVTIQGFGQNSTNALFAAVSPRWSDTLFRTPEQDWYGGQPTGWVLHDSVLLDNGPNGFSLGNKGAAVRVTASGHLKTGIGMDRIRGGLIDSCTLRGNSLAPAGGELADGADIKGVFVNGTRGVTDVETAAYIPPVALFQVVNSTFQAKDPRTGKGAKIGLWFDLDSQSVEVDRCLFEGYEWAGFVSEVGTKMTVTNSVFRDCGGYGRALGQDFVLGALTFRETCWARAEGNRFEGCGVPIVVALSNRTSDLFRAPTRPWDVNYAWRGAPWQSDPAQRHEWIDPEYRRANQAGTMSNLATAEIDIVGNRVDGGRVMINAGSVKGGQDPQGAMRALLSTVRFRGNTYGSGVTFDELERQGLTLAQWQELGRAGGRSRDQ